MTEPSEAHDELLNQLADEFAARRRSGERPALEEYCERHPDLADDIRSLFPALVELERVKADAGREVSLYRGPMPAASSAALAAHLLGRETSPTQAAVRAERLLRLQEALNALDPLDREILSLRHFEELTHAEAARVLEIQEAAAAKRYVRALKRLKDVLAAL